MEEQAAKLLETINRLIDTGADQLPWAAEQSLAALQAYWAVNSLLGLLGMALAVPMVLISEWAFKHIEDDDDPRIAVVVIFGVGALTVFGIGMTVFISNVSGWFSPLGRILANHIG